MLIVVSLVSALETQSYNPNVKTHSSEVRPRNYKLHTQKKNTHGHYCELFTCRDGFAFLPDLVNLCWLFLILVSSLF